MGIHVLSRVWQLIEVLKQPSGDGHPDSLKDIIGFIEQSIVLLGQ